MRIERMSGPKKNISVLVPSVILSLTVTVCVYGMCIASGSSLNKLTFSNLTACTTFLCTDEKYVGILAVIGLISFIRCRRTNVAMKFKT